jgi:hypothetical protein
MAKNIISKIENEISVSSELSAKNKNELLTLMGELKNELQSVEQQHRDKAANIAKLTTDSTTAVLKNAKIFASDPTYNELRSAVAEFEVSHPDLVRVVNQICIMLSSIGI